jgi:ATP diphosphatase
MVERHPHVFGDRDANTAQAVLTNWESDKAAKREAQAKAEGRTLSILDDITTTLPAVTRAVKLQKRAARVGFDWTDAKDILAKIREEADELEDEMNKGAPQSAVEDELGDLFFAIVNLARRLDIDPESALRSTNRKFERRFREIEKRFQVQNRSIDGASLDEMERMWVEIKNEEKRLKKSA